MSQSMSLALFRSGPVVRYLTVNRCLATRRQQEIESGPARVRGLNNNPQMCVNYHMYSNTGQFVKVPTHRCVAILMP